MAEHGATLAEHTATLDEHTGRFDSVDAQLRSLTRLVGKVWQGPGPAPRAVTGAGSPVR